MFTVTNYSISILVLLQFRYFLSKFFIILNRFQPYYILINKKIKINSQGKLALNFNMIIYDHTEA